MSRSTPRHTFACCLLSPADSGFTDACGAASASDTRDALCRPTSDRGALHRRVGIQEPSIDINSAIVHVMSTLSPTFTFDSAAVSWTRLLYFQPFGPVNVIDEAF